MKERHVLYPGSFDPVTLGHLDILQRARQLFGRVTVVVAEKGKAGLLPVTDRVSLFRAAVEGLDGVEVHPFSGLLVDEVRARAADAVIRGIRSSGDYEHEWSLAGVNALLADNIEYVYLLARPEMSAVSSSLVRDVVVHGGPLEKLVPAPVAVELAKRYGGKER
jgi:pantetheine-phosphate adenylyltransferase